MIQIPAHILSKYKAFIEHKGIQAPVQQYYVKWLRYYFDFCHKYNFPLNENNGLFAFVEKLREKKQTENQRKQAFHAISLYHEMVRHLKRKSSNDSFKDNGTVKSQFLPDTQYSHTQQTAINQENQANGATSLRTGELLPRTDEVLKQTGADWTGVTNDLKNAIQIRHYSPATLKTYSGWTRKFQSYTKSKDPVLLTAEDVKTFLTWLAVEKNVSASSQNQAFNALLFLFRHVLNKEFGKVDGVVRAKRKPYIPVVLSKEDVQRIIGLLHYP
ncbi:MAG: phage integrase N-terminal SAM-like domain-containing protein, partial [Nanoarchaeota archaeon]|nr:phage integrase N-terminal SAM-like domain-containing protein [Nanoarchaeota archaeon]